jgi:hypothetical protein
MATCISRPFSRLGLQIIAAGTLAHVIGASSGQISVTDIRNLIRFLALLWGLRVSVKSMTNKGGATRWVLALARHLLRALGLPLGRAYLSHAT